MPTIEINVTPYGPEESDDNPAAYLVRCGEAMYEQYGYDYEIRIQPGDPATRVLQVNIPIADPASPDRKRPVAITAPEVAMDVAGDLMTETVFNAKFGVS